MVTVKSATGGVLVLSCMNYCWQGKYRSGVLVVTVKFMTGGVLVLSCMNY